MTALPACLPAGIAACMVAAGVCGVLGAASAWIDWRGRRRGALYGSQSPVPAPEAPEPRIHATGRPTGAHGTSIPPSKTAAQTKSEGAH